MTLTHWVETGFPLFHFTFDNQSRERSTCSQKNEVGRLNHGHSTIYIRRFCLGNTKSTTIELGHLY